MPSLSSVGSVGMVVPVVRVKASTCNTRLLSHFGTRTGVGQ